MPELPTTTTAEVKSRILAKLTYAIGKDPVVAKRHDWLNATILALRDSIIDRWMESTRAAYKADAKRVYYLSLEFLIGRLLQDALSNLDLTKPFDDALTELGVDMELLQELEPDAALGNGGLGRLAACFMESMASLDIPAYGYGIRYSHGLFRQTIHDGWQNERPETWLDSGNAWEFPRREAAYMIGYYGHVTTDASGDFRHKAHWHPGEAILASAFDTPVTGWRGRRVNTLRLWSAKPIDPIHLDAFNAGDYAGALNDHNRAEIITRVLYPADSTPQGQELRLRQEYFFTSASLQDILRRHTQSHTDLLTLPDYAAIQLNDTHPAIAIAEMMRMLVDIHGLEWKKAWSVTQQVTAYTNHTLLPEALETWPVALLERVLPRHMQIIYAINEDLLEISRTRKNVTPEFISSVSLISENGERRVRMGQLAFVGAHSINGVSALHTDLMKKTVFRDMHALYPGRINNKTNGITPRRWLNSANPALVELLRASIGDGFLDDLTAIKSALPFAADRAFQKSYASIKRANKASLSNLIAARLGILADPDALFDVQIKRIHEYKRQLLNIMETIAHYQAMRDAPHLDWAPRVKIFAGKSAASYVQAKLIIKLINDVAEKINGDHALKGRLKVVFIPNYNVSLAEEIVPAADLSEQISTAGMEASGTGNMKLSLNGALTVGTLDGANVEIRDHVGAENFFLFGMEAAEVEVRRKAGVDGQAVLEATPALKRVCEALLAGQFSNGDTMRYRTLVESLTHGDWFMVASDFASYATAQADVSALWAQPKDWTRKAILNTVSMGWFSSDRTIRDYARDIWTVPVK
jgi:glycogen phosphorylase